MKQGIKLIVVLILVGCFAVFIMRLEYKTRLNEGIKSNHKIEPTLIITDKDTTYLYKFKNI